MGSATNQLDCQILKRRNFCPMRVCGWISGSQVVNIFHLVGSSCSRGLNRRVDVHSQISPTLIMANSEQSMSSRHLIWKDIICQWPTNWVAFGEVGYLDISVCVSKLPLDRIREGWICDHVWACITLIIDFKVSCFVDACSIKGWKAYFNLIASMMNCIRVEF